MSSTGTARRAMSAACIAGAGMLICAVAGRADAACLDNLVRRTAPAAKPIAVSPAAALRAVPAIYRLDASPIGSRAAFDDDKDNDRQSIVGLWEFQIDGTPADFGTQAWHADGTELMFSAGRNPAQGDICQGVWRKIGPRTYSLNHIAMGWDPGFFGVRVHIHAVVKVDPSGDTYSGTYTAAAFFVTPAAPFDETAPLGGGSGHITGTRVKAD